MNSVTIRTALKRLRTNLQLSPQDVSVLLHSKYSIEVSAQTLLDYEAGSSTPDISHFLALCKLYDCPDVLHTFGYSDENFAFCKLLPEEQQIINNYRKLPTLEKNMILGALGIKKERVLQRIALLTDKGILLSLTS